MRRSKKDLDMESMFQKIMPSAAGGKVENPIAPHAPNTDESAQSESATDVPNAPAQPAAKAAPRASKAKAKPKTAEASTTANATTAAALLERATAAEATAPLPAAVAASATLEAAPIALQPVPSALVATPATPQDTPVAAAIAPAAPQEQPFPVAADLASIEKPMLVNLARPFLESRLDAALDKFQCCKCEKCQLDVLAVALNKVAPQYATLPPNAEPLAYVTSEFARDAITGLVQSILQIKSHPRH